VDVDASTPLPFVLADELGLRGPKFGCGMAQCGACTVIRRRQAVRSCVMPVSEVGQDEITTLEGLGTPEKPHPIQQAFIRFDRGRPTALSGGSQESDSCRHDRQHAGPGIYIRSTSCAATKEESDTGRVRRNHCKQGGLAAEAPGFHRLAIR
jgi:hypothetical protein